MILKFSSTSYKYNGRVQDEVWTSSGLRGIARRRIRPARPDSRFEYKPLFSLATARDAWVLLNSETRTEWDDLAESTFGWLLQGSPRFMDGETFFANYYTVLLSLDPYAAVPDPPDAGPVWQTKPKFFEFASWQFGIYSLKAETEFDANTVLLFSGLPPSVSGFKPDFAREVFIGSDDLWMGLYPDDQYEQVHYMMENKFGTIDSSMKIWGRVWECQDGFIRTIKDPCAPDPTDAPVGAVLGVELYNDYAGQIYFGYVDLYQEDFEVIGESYFELLDGFATTEYNIDLTEGKTLDDIGYVAFQVYWQDGGSFFSNEPYALEDPFPFAMTPGF